MHEYKDITGKVIKIGDTVKQHVTGKEGKVTSFSPCGYYIRINGREGSFNGVSGDYTILESAPCCTLQEAADLLEAKGIQVDRKQLERVLNPRPKTLPLNKIRLRDTNGDGTTYIVTAYKPYHFQAICLADHVRWNEGCKLSGGPSGICLNELENSVVARGLTLLDTWSPDTEFPELLDKPELLES